MSRIPPNPWEGQPIYAEPLTDIVVKSKKSPAEKVMYGGSANPNVFQNQIKELNILWKNGNYYLSSGEIAGALVAFSNYSVYAHILLDEHVTKAGASENGAAAEAARVPPFPPLSEGLVIEGATDERDVKLALEKTMQIALGYVETLQVKLSAITRGEDDKKEMEDAEVCINQSQDIIIQFEGKNCITYNDIVGLEKEKKAVKDSFVRPIIYKRLYGDLAKGMLLYGPPGTGKTLLAKASATQLQLENPKVRLVFLAPTGASLKGKYVGETEKNILRAFRCASVIAENCQSKSKKDEKYLAVIFIDEFDSIAGDRSTDTTGLVANSVNTLLQVMDGVISYPNVVLIAATNYPWNLDSAILRRFDQQLLLDYPSFEMIRDIAYKEIRKHYFQPYWKEIEKTVKKIHEKKNPCDFTCGIVEKVKLDELSKPFNKFMYDFKIKNVQFQQLCDELYSQKYSNSDVAKVIQLAIRQAASKSIRYPFISGGLYFNTDERSRTEQIADKFISVFSKPRDTKELNTIINAITDVNYESYPNIYFEKNSLEPNAFMKAIIYDKEIYYNTKLMVDLPSDFYLDDVEISDFFIKRDTVIKLRESNGMDVDVTLIFSKDMKLSNSIPPTKLNFSNICRLLEQFVNDPSQLVYKVTAEESLDAAVREADAASEAMAREAAAGSAPKSAAAVGAEVAGPVTVNGVDLFFEKQTGLMSCGRHALNNALQGVYYLKEGSRPTTMEDLQRRPSPPTGGFSASGVATDNQYGLHQLMTLLNTEFNRLNPDFAGGTGRTLFEWRNNEHYEYHFINAAMEVAGWKKLGEASAFKPEQLETLLQTGVKNHLRDKKMILLREGGAGHFISYLPVAQGDTTVFFVLDSTQLTPTKINKPVELRDHIRSNRRFQFMVYGPKEEGEVFVDGTTSYPAYPNLYLAKMREIEVSPERRAAETSLRDYLATSRFTAEQISFIMTTLSDIGFDIMTNVQYIALLNYIQTGEPRVLDNSSNNDTIFKSIYFAVNDILNPPASSSASADGSGGVAGRGNGNRGRGALNGRGNGRGALNGNGGNGRGNGNRGRGRGTGEVTGPPAPLLPGGSSLRTATAGLADVSSTSGLGTVERRVSSPRGAASALRVGRVVRGSSPPSPPPSAAAASGMNGGGDFFDSLDKAFSQNVKYDKGEANTIFTSQNILFKTENNFGDDLLKYLDDFKTYFKSYTKLNDIGFIKGKDDKEKEKNKKNLDNILDNKFFGVLKTEYVQYTTFFLISQFILFALRRMKQAYDDSLTETTMTTVAAGLSAVEQASIDIQTLLIELNKEDFFINPSWLAVGRQKTPDDVLAYGNEVLLRGLLGLKGDDKKTFDEAFPGILLPPLEEFLKVTEINELKKEYDIIYKSLKAFYSKKQRGVLKDEDKTKELTDFYTKSLNGKTYKIGDKDITINLPEEKQIYKDIFNEGIKYLMYLSNTIKSKIKGKKVVSGGPFVGNRLEDVDYKPAVYVTEYGVVLLGGGTRKRRASKKNRTRTLKGGAKGTKTLHQLHEYTEKLSKPIKKAKNAKDENIKYLTNLIKAFVTLKTSDTVKLSGMGISDLADIVTMSIELKQFNTQFYFVSRFHTNSVQWRPTYYVDSRVVKDFFTQNVEVDLGKLQGNKSGLFKFLMTRSVALGFLSFGDNITGIKDIPRANMNIKWFKFKATKLTRINKKIDELSALAAPIAIGLKLGSYLYPPAVSLAKDYLPEDLLAYLRSGKQAATTAASEFQFGFESAGLPVGEGITPASTLGQVGQRTGEVVQLSGQAAEAVSGVGSTIGSATSGAKEAVKGAAKSAESALAGKLPGFMKDILRGPRNFMKALLHISYSIFKGVAVGSVGTAATMLGVAKEYYRGCLIFLFLTRNVAMPGYNYWLTSRDENYSVLHAGLLMTFEGKSELFGEFSDETSLSKNIGAQLMKIIENGVKMKFKESENSFADSESHPYSKAVKALLRGMKNTGPFFAWIFSGLFNVAFPRDFYFIPTTEETNTGRFGTLKIDRKTEEKILSDKQKTYDALKDNPAKRAIVEKEILNSIETILLRKQNFYNQIKENTGTIKGFFPKYLNTYKQADVLEDLKNRVLTALNEYDAILNEASAEVNSLLTGEAREKAIRNKETRKNVELDTFKQKYPRLLLDMEILNDLTSFYFAAGTVENGLLDSFKGALENPAGEVVDGVRPSAYPKDTIDNIIEVINDKYREIKYDMFKNFFRDLITEGRVVRTPITNENTIPWTEGAIRRFGNEQLNKIMKPIYINLLQKFEIGEKIGAENLNKIKGKILQIKNIYSEQTASFASKNYLLLDIKKLKDEENVAEKLINLNMPLACFTEAIALFPSNYDKKIHDDLIAYNTNKNKFMESYRARQKKPTG